MQQGRKMKSEKMRNEFQKAKRRVKEPVHNLFSINYQSLHQPKTGLPRGPILTVYEAPNMGHIYIILTVT